MDEDKLKDELVTQVQKMAALLTIYTQVMGVDAYECNLEFMVADGEARIRLTDSKFKVDPKTGKLNKIPTGEGPHASSLDDAEARRQKGGKAPEPPEKVPTAEETVAALMKKLGLK